LGVGVSKKDRDFVTGFVRTAAIETGSRYGRRTYYGGTVEIEPPDTEVIHNPDDPRFVRAVDRAFEEIASRILRIPLYRVGVRPDPEGRLHVVETFDAESGKLILTWRCPFVEGGRGSIH
jgi:hypothetical protein